MTRPDFVLLYVEDPVRSAAFYERLLGRAPVEASPGFALFVLDGGLKIGLWKRAEVQPAAHATGGGCELALAVESNAAVDAAHAQWRADGLTILQAPTAMDFGYTFTAADPDGHRLRVFAPAG